MGDGFLGTAIRRTGRNRVLLGLSGFLVVVVIFCFARPYLYNFFHGPFPTDQATLLSMQDPDTRRQSFLTIQGDETFQTGFEETSTDYFVTTHHPLLAMKVGDRLLLVKAASDTEATKFSGEITSIPSDVRTDVLQVLQRKYPDMKDQFLPLMLDATNYRLGGYVGIPVGILFGLGFIWFAGRGMQWCRKPETHPVWRKLGKYGPAQQVGSQLDVEIRSEGGGETFGSTHLTTNWLAHSSRYNIEVIRTADLVWAYQQVVKHYHSGIPTGKSFFVKVFDRDGALILISSKKSAAPELLQSLQRRAPWAVFGFSAELEKVWKTRRAEFLSTVEQRKGKPAAAPSAAKPAADKKELVRV
jgi:hypothetical protein